MIRILHLADIHLGIELYGRVDPATGLSSRLGDFLRTLDVALDYAVEHEFDLVLFAGDVYKNRDPSPTVQREFARRIRRLSQAGMPTFLLVGNHDLPNTPTRAHTVEIFDTLAVPNVYVARVPKLYTVPTKSGMVQIAALPWITPHTLLTRDEFRGVNMDEVNALMLDRIEGVIDNMADQIDPHYPAILTAHAAIHGATMPNAQKVGYNGEMTLPKTFISHSQFDYVALGHIHKYQTVGFHPLAIYPGSLERVDFGEEKEPKGFVTVEIGAREPGSDNNVKHEFHEVPARRFVTLRIAAEGDDPNATVLQKLAEKAVEIEDAVVRVVITTTPEKETALRDDEIRKALAGAAYIASVSREVDRPSRVRMGDHTIEVLSPRQALELFLKTKNTQADRTVTLLSYADRLLKSQDD